MSTVFDDDDLEDEDTQEFGPEPEALPVDADGWVHYRLGGPFGEPS